MANTFDEAVIEFEEMKKKWEASRKNPYLRRPFDNAKELCLRMSRMTPADRKFQDYLNTFNDARVVFYNVLLDCETKGK